jgi:REP element-mobilizing transposase RayT
LDVAVIAVSIRNEHSPLLCSTLPRGDRLDFLDIVAQALSPFDAQLLAYCLMCNHYHFVLHTTGQSVAAHVQALAPISLRYIRAAGSGLCDTGGPFPDRSAQVSAMKAGLRVTEH